MREFSVPVLVDVPPSANCTDVVFQRGVDEPDAVVIRRKEGEDPAAPWTPVTAAQFRDRVAAVAKGLIAAGIEPGDRVGLMSRTRYEWTVADYAIWAAGAVGVPIYETSSADQVKWILTDSGAKAAFVETAAHEETVREAVPGLPLLWRIDGAGVAELERLGAEVTNDTLAERRTSRGGLDLATIIYTSGTTGMPKGCRLTHDNLLFTARNVSRGPLEALFDVEGRAALLFLPLAHSFARLIQIVLIETGTVLAHSPNMKNVAPDLREFKPTFLLGVPRVFEKVYNAAEQKADAEGKGKIFHAAVRTAIEWSRAESSGGAGLGARLKHAAFDKLVYGKLRAATGGALTAAVSGGSALGERLGHFFRGVGIEVFEGWGLTETSAPSTVNIPGANKIGTVGKPFPGVSIRIADDGEILVKGRHVFDGYWNNERATKEAIDPEGWFHTGDVGRLDEHGYLSITGRKKEILVTAGGKNVAPAPLEDAIRAHRLISQVMVVGDGKPFIGAIVTLDHEAMEQWKQANGRSGASMAELCSDPGVVAEVQQAVDDANRMVSKAEQIKKFGILDIELSEETGHVTPKQSIKRHVVARDFAKQIDELYGD
ncbi:AMP-dependent synthetase/ligase [Microbispora bryophytorum]|uniref:Acyl-CoA synthetase n=1 Tax=Microbispora bryophytorum TaxID=1460882 RepID=A0A8H9GZ73_9ACTN|nr:AMP-dependent synthetase/ligase [Microbispora bryophytorum]MBD3134935.1 long-chain fatty acid--CoA ligase [Microbispora bryophytorum]TQS08818.1 long-chain fatty acid--CoA ligase [Microbispora bryophytorum]GGO11509.1 long-chain-fatty-acid--CoA ligase [Microbispora bryophytorum]